MRIHGQSDFFFGKMLWYFYTLSVQFSRGTLSVRDWSERGMMMSFAKVCPVGNGPCSCTFLELDQRKSQSSFPVPSRLLK